MTSTKGVTGHLTVAALTLFAVTAVAETPASQLGKWRLNTGKSDQGKNPNPVVEAVLDVTADDGKTLRFTLVENLKDGSKLSYKWDGAYDGVIRPAADFYSVGYEHVPGGWRDSWEMTAGQAKGLKGSDVCKLSPDGQQQICRGGLAGSPPSYTLIYDKALN